MIARYLRLNYTILWLLAAATGWAENWLLRTYGLSIAQRAAVVSGFLPLIVLLALICAFHESALHGK
jgi:hypothetical protein